jgi:hypothetical protein
MRRRALLLSVSSVPLAWAADAGAKTQAKVAPIPPIPLRVFVGQLPAASPEKAPTPVVDGAFVDAQLAQAAALFSPHGLAFEERERSSLAVGDLLTREDRNGLSKHLEAERCNVFFVGRLRDVDDPALDRMGVMWRNLRNLKQKYVIVSSAARETTLAPELGHFLGNPHSFVKNNLMSYERDGGPVFLDESQGAISRRTARALFASKELA